jgi:glycosyltransferase involved in cell wall biosynthesis
MSDIKLSYVITTFNKLPYLKEVMRTLLLNKKIDEEIVVADGGSTDGTIEFLKDLTSQGKIDQFISEKDRGEAHGFNKTILMARGVLIKILSDDDVYYYPAIEECRTFMEQNKTIDALVGNNATTFSTVMDIPLLNSEMQSEFEKWASGINATFYCNGLSLMIRKSSVSLLGLFNTRFLCVDLEYTIRTGGIANYAFATKFLVTRIINPNSNGARYAERCKEERLQLCRMYNYPVPPTWNEIKNETTKRTTWWRFKNYINTFIKSVSEPVPLVIDNDERIDTVSLPDLTLLYDYQYKQLETLNRARKSDFLTRM